jgi:hypothetical protein
MRNMTADDAVTVHSDSHHPFGMAKGGQWLTDKKATMILCSVISNPGKKILFRTADFAGRAITVQITLIIDVTVVAVATFIAGVANTMELTVAPWLAYTAVTYTTTSFRNGFYMSSRNIGVFPVEFQIKFLLRLGGLDWNGRKQIIDIVFAAGVLKRSQKVRSIKIASKNS